MIVSGNDTPRATVRVAKQPGQAKPLQSKWSLKGSSIRWCLQSSSIHVLRLQSHEVREKTSNFSVPSCQRRLVGESPLRSMIVFTMPLPPPENLARPRDYNPQDLEGMDAEEVERHLEQAIEGVYYLGFYLRKGADNVIKLRARKAQLEQQNGEIRRLRLENERLRGENEALKVGGRRLLGPAQEMANLWVAARVATSDLNLCEPGSFTAQRSPSLQEEARTTPVSLTRRRSRGNGIDVLWIRLPTMLCHSSWGPKYESPSDAHRGSTLNSFFSRIHCSYPKRFTSYNFSSEQTAPTKSRQWQ
jgi:hypothetical protein